MSLLQTQVMLIFWLLCHRLKALDNEASAYLKKDIPSRNRFSDKPKISLHNITSLLAFFLSTSSRTLPLIVRKGNNILFVKETAPRVGDYFAAL